MGKPNGNGNNGNGVNPRKIGICPKCEEYRRLTHHHILPKRHGGADGPGIKLCWDCHCELEDMIALVEGRRRHRLSVRSYFRITANFLREADDRVMDRLMNQFAIQLDLAS